MFNVLDSHTDALLVVSSPPTGQKSNKKETEGSGSGSSAQTEPLKFMLCNSKTVDLFGCNFTDAN